MNALARSSDIQRSFLSVSCEHYGSIPTLAAQTCDPAEAVTGLKRGAAEQVRNDFFMRSIKKSSRTSAVRDDDGARDET